MLRVLAIDDSRTMRGLLEQALNDAGFCVDLAEDGADGLRALEACAPDVIVTDINMPNLDGFGLIKAVRDHHERRDLPILVLTTESAQTLRDRARGLGATGWIVKPFDDEKLVRAIKLVTARKV